jgi:hypothetical protein
MIITKDDIKTHTIDMDKVAINVDTSDPTKIAIYMLDDRGCRVEGGTFSRRDLVKSIVEFYDKNY